MSYYVKVILGFIVLDLYLNVGIAKSSQFFIQVLLVLMFFPLLKGILTLTKVKEYKNIGIDFHQKWWINMTIGFMIGFSFWLMKYILVYLFGGFKVTGVMSFPEMVPSVVMIMLIFLVGSFLNDIIVRGFVFGHLKGKIPVKWVFIISLLLYSLDDSWNEGFSMSNMVFSLLLGLSLTYATFKTGSLWANTGIHWGLNVCYGIFNGPLGSTDGGIIITKYEQSTIFLEIIGYIVPVLMFLFVYLLRNKFEREK